MQSLSATVYLTLCAIAPFTQAVHSHHSHSRSSGYRSVINSGTPSTPGSNAAPFPIGAPSNGPFPLGNGTVGGPTGTGTGSISTTITISIQSTIYVTAPEGERSPTSAGGADGSAGATGPALGAPMSALSNIPGTLGEVVSSCVSPVTVTTTTDTTVTVIQVSSPSGNPIESQAPLGSLSAGTSQARSQSQATVQSSAPVAPQPSVPIATASSVAVVASQAPGSTTNTVVELTDRQVGYSVPSQIASSTPASSTLASIPIASATSSSLVSSSIATSTPSSALVSSNNLTPNGIKAGVAGYRSITAKSSWSQFSPHIGWYSDYWPNTPDSGSVTGVPMVSPYSPTSYAQGMILYVGIAPSPVRHSLTCLPAIALGRRSSRRRRRLSPRGIQSPNNNAEIYDGLLRTRLDTSRLIQNRLRLSRQHLVLPHRSPRHKRHPPRLSQSGDPKRRKLADAF